MCGLEECNFHYRCQIAALKRGINPQISQISNLEAIRSAIDDIKSETNRVTNDIRSEVDKLKSETERATNGLAANLRSAICTLTSETERARTDLEATLRSDIEKLKTETSQTTADIVAIFSSLRLNIVTTTSITSDVARLKTVQNETAEEIKQLRSYVLELAFHTRPSVILPCQPIQSMILREIPEILNDFQTKKWKLLWRGSRDGFEAQTFHDRCDGVANTLTLVLDMEWNVFGGFTSVKWDSGCLDRLGDRSLRSFLFMLRIPGNFSGKRFPLNEHSWEHAIYCDEKHGPWFGNDNLVVSDCSNSNSDSYIRKGRAYELDGFSTPDEILFRVKEIEVFEIKD
jgi:archaellum component FlaC